MPRPVTTTSINPLRLSLHNQQQQQQQQQQEKRLSAMTRTASPSRGAEGDRKHLHAEAEESSPSGRRHHPAPPPLCEEGSKRAARRKELMLDDEVLESSAWQPRRWVAWRQWVYYFLILGTVGTVWIVCQWSFMRKRLHLTLSKPARQDNCDFIIVEASKKQGSAVEICEVEIQHQTPIELLTDWKELRKRRKAIAHTKAGGDKSRLMVVYRHTRFFFNPFSNRFQQADSEDLTCPEKSPSFTQGLSSREASLRLDLFGLSLIDVPMPSTLTLLIRECIHPFVVFQLWAVCVWMSEQYWSFSAFILVAALATAFANFAEVKRNLQDIRALSRYSCTVKVIRDGGQVHTIDSSLLVPGDVFAVESDMRLPSCDSVLIKGSCSVMEAMLTGESTVVIKSPLLPGAGGANINDALPRNTLFGGSNIAQLRGVVGTSSSSSSPPVLAMVVRTGFESVKGRLVLAILYPRVPTFKFLEQSLWFIAALFALAMVGFGINAKALSDAGTETPKIIQRGADMVTIVVPPALPLALTAGIAFALIALRRRDRVICISPQRVNLAGKINYCCFDKTGTLTTEGLAFDCVKQVKKQQQQVKRATTTGTGDQASFTVVPAAFEEDEVRGVGSTAEGDQTAAASDGHPFPAPLSSASLLRPTMRALLACCHSLSFVKGVLSGDPLEVETFAFSGANITELAQQSVSDSDSGDGGVTVQAAGQAAVSLPLHASAIVRVPIAQPRNQQNDDESPLPPPSSSLLDLLDAELTSHGTTKPVSSPSLRGMAVSSSSSSSAANSMRGSSGVLVPARGRSRSSLGGGGVSLSVLSIFEFVPALQRMGALCCLDSPVPELEGNNSRRRVFISFVKGAPEMIQSLSLPSSLPSDFHPQLKGYTSKGLRVIGAAVRLVSEAELVSCFVGRNGSRIGFSDSSSRLRTLCESNLTFTGLIALENKLKPESAPTIASLQLQGGISCCMITGDNSVAAVAIARKCGLVAAERSRCRVFIGDLAANTTPPPSSSTNGVGGHALLDATSIISPQPSPTPDDGDSAVSAASSSFSALDAAVVPSLPGAVASAAAPLTSLGGIGIAPFQQGSSSALLTRVASFSSVASSGSNASDESMIPAAAAAAAAAASPVLMISMPEPAALSSAPLSPLAGAGEEAFSARPMIDEEQGSHSHSHSHSHPLARVTWTDVDDEGSHLDAVTLLPCSNPSAKAADSSPYCLALTGKAFAYLQECVRSGSVDASFLQKVCLHTPVFARMSPENKAAAVEILQSMGLYVAMSGDGANDSLALRAAHVGVSLSQAEASVSAPFSSLNPNISCLIPLLCEGRGALATSFCLFGFFALYSTIQFANALLIVFRASFLSNNEYLWQDLIIVFVLSLTMGSTPSAQRLTLKRPSANLLSLYNLTLSAGFIALTFLFQIWAYSEVQQQPWYGTDAAYPLAMDPEQDEEGTNSVIPETTSVFLMASLQYCALAAIFCWGLPWKQNTFKTNWIFTGWLLLVFLLSFVLFLAQPQALYTWIGLQTLPIEWNRKLLAMSLFSFLSYFLFVGLITLMRRRGWFTRAQQLFYSSLWSSSSSPSSASGTKINGVSIHKVLKKEWKTAQRRAGIQPLASFAGTTAGGPPAMMVTTVVK